MAKESSDSASGKYGEPRKHDADFKGPLSKRSCTDVICCLVFLVFLGAYVALSVVAFVFGDPRILFYGTDLNGQLCGVEQLADKPHLFFFDLTYCATVQPGQKCPTPQVCVSRCPDYYWNWAEAELDDSVQQRQKMICYYNVNATADSRSIRELVYAGLCAPYLLEETSFVGRCLPKSLDTSIGYLNNLTKIYPGWNFEEELLKTGMEKITSLLGWVSPIFEDLKESWLLILLGLTIGMLLSLAWLLLLRFFAGVIVWTILFAFIATFSATTGYTVYRFIQAEGLSDLGEAKLTTDLNFYLTQAWFWLTLAIISGVILLIVLVVLIFLRKRIRIAIALIRQTSKALAYMFEALVFPILPFVFHALVITYFVVVAAFLATMKVKESSPMNVTNSTLQSLQQCGSGTVGQACTLTATYIVQNSVWSSLFNLFMSFWLFFFVSGLSQMTIAGSFAAYYFTRRKPKDVPCCSVVRSLGRVLRYHLGTVAFGSLLIAIVKTIRAVLEYFKAKSGGQNACAKFLLKCLSCCFWCLEKILKFITKNAYIMTAIRGRNFCFSAKDAFFLIMRNFLRAAVLDGSTTFVLFVGQLLVIGLVSFVSYMFFGSFIPGLEGFAPELTYFFVPVIAVAFGTFIIAATFFSVYDMGVDTLFLCFLEDLEMNDGSAEKPYYMGKGLRKILGKKNKKSKKKNKKEKKEKKEEKGKTREDDYAESAM